MSSDFKMYSSDFKCIMEVTPEENKLHHFDTLIVPRRQKWIHRMQILCDLGVGGGGVLGGGGGGG